MKLGVVLTAGGTGSASAWAHPETVLEIKPGLPAPALRAGDLQRLARGRGHR